MLNVLSIAGRLVQKPELKSTSCSFSVVEFNLAIPQFSKKEKKEALFLKCVAYSNIAERICKYCAKGDKIAITGKLESYSYTDKNGERQTRLQANVGNVEFMGASHKSSWQPATSDVGAMAKSAASSDYQDGHEGLKELEALLNG